MSTLIIADIHLSANPRDAYRLATMRRLVDRARKRGIERTFILGDLTEEKDRHSDWLTNQVVEIIRLYATLGPVTILQGNHDSDNDPECPFFHFLRHVPQVRWIGKPTAERIKGLGCVLWLPHNRNFKKAVAEFANQKFEYVFLHGMLLGAQLGNNRASTEGVPRKALPRSAHVYAGDIHIPQDEDSFVYVGAPYTVDFGDHYAARAIVIDGMGRREKDIDLSRWPQKRLLEFDGAPLEVDRIDGLREGDIVKIRVTLQRRDASRWPEARDKLRKLVGDLGMIVHSIVPVIVERPGTRVRISGMQLKSDKQILYEFAQHRGIDKATLQQGEKML